MAVSLGKVSKRSTDSHCVSVISDRKWTEDSRMGECGDRKQVSGGGTAQDTWLESS